jgi:hypothetical protein
MVLSVAGCGLANSGGATAAARNRAAHRGMVPGREYRSLRPAGFGALPAEGSASDDSGGCAGAAVSAPWPWAVCSGLAQSRRAEAAAARPRGRGDSGRGFQGGALVRADCPRGRRRQASFQRRRRQATGHPAAHRYQQRVEPCRNAAAMARRRAWSLHLDAGRNLLVARSVVSRMTIFTVRK